MNWQEILTSALIAAIISAAVVLVGVVLTDLLSSRRVENSLAKHDERLISTQSKITELSKEQSGEHKELSGEHQGLAKDHSFIIGKIDDVYKMTSKTYFSFSKEEERQINRYENLSDTQKQINNSVQNVGKLLDDWKQVITENDQLHTSINRLNRKYELLESRLTELQTENRQLKEQINSQRRPERTRGFGPER